MKFRKLGRTGLQVSEIGLGCWAFGGTGYGPVTDKASLETLEAAWEHQVNFFDTADTYGHGRSEKVLARFLKGKPREKIVLASKVGWDFYHGGNKKNWDSDYLTFACEESLKRLEVETLDLLQLHNPPLALIRSGEPVGVLEALKKAGKIRFIGISIHTEADALAAIEDKRVDTLQLVFNILDQRMAARIFKEAAARGVGVIVREPLACGLLTDKHKPDRRYDKDDHRRRWVEEKKALDWKKLERIKPALATARLSLACAALEYTLEYPEVSTVIPGAKTRGQMLENLKATEDPSLRSQEASYLKDLFMKEALFSQGL